MLVRKSGYIICAPNWVRFHERLESIFFERTKVESQALQNDFFVMYDIINPNSLVSIKDRAKRMICLDKIRRREFSVILLRGEMASPYIGAVLKAAQTHTEVLNKATVDSQLDFCIALHQLEQKSSART